MARSRVSLSSFYAEIDMVKFLFLLFLLFNAAAPSPIAAQSTAASSAPTAPLMGQTDPTQESAKSVSNPSMVTKMAIIAGLSLLPFAIMLLTSFMKIIIVLSLLRNAIGVQQTPPNQVMNGIALMITIYVMFPTGLAMYKAAQDVKMKAPSALISPDSASYMILVLDKAKEPLRGFLQRNAIAAHMQSFYKLGYNIFPEPFKTDLKSNDFIVLIPAFITSQLKTAFEIGVLIYLPFFVIDLVVSNILLAMGMMMLDSLSAWTRGIL